jgi:pyrroline-5-carboxylate reductase
MIPGAGPLVLLGCGKMGSALLSGWLERGVGPEAVYVVEPSADAFGPFAARGLRRVDRGADLLPDLRPEVVVVAVKPQVMVEAVAGLERFAASALFVSIAAGKTLGFFAERLGGDAAVVRAMPNTPAAVGRGITVLCANDRVDGDRRALAEALLTAVGEVAWVENEGLIDAVTAVSGGGPAYVFLLIECLARAGVEAGLPEDLAMRLARVTVAGSGELVHRSDAPAAELRRNVTSPGGTTQEALAVLMADDALQALMTRAITAATRRSRELAG